MGAGDLSAMTKGPVHRAIEVCLNEDDGSGYYAKRDRFLQELERFASVLDCRPEFVRIVKEIAQVTEESGRYLETKWLTWWPEKRLLGPIVCQGIVRAIKAANDPALPKKLPIDFYWFAVGQRDPTLPLDTYPLETIVTRSNWQVTCILVTPPAPEEAPASYLGRLTEDADIWTVKDRTSIPDQPAEKLLENHGNGLVTTRAIIIPLTDSMHSPTVRQQAAQRRDQAGSSAKQV
jgi:hypothetical protein